MGLAAAMCVLPGCGETAEETTASVDTAPAETEAADTPELESSWIGSFSTSNAMGDVVSGHLLNFYDDGTCRIYYGIKAGMQGHHYGSYEGTYTEDGTVSYTYVHAKDNQTVEEGSFTADLDSDTFQAMVFCMANFPNSAAGGIHYVRINPVEPDMEAEYVYGGSRVSADGFYGSLIQLKDGVMTGSAAANGVTGTFGGTYTINYSAVTDIDTPDMLMLSYAPLTVGEFSVTSEGEAVESGIEFNDTTSVSYTLNSADGSFPRIPMAAIISQDGTYNEN